MYKDIVGYVNIIQIGQRYLKRSQYRRIAKSDFQSNRISLAICNKQRPNEVKQESRCRKNLQISLSSINFFSARPQYQYLKYLALSSYSLSYFVCSFHKTSLGSSSGNSTSSHPIGSSLFFSLFRIVPSDRPMGRFPGFSRAPYKW